MQSVFVLTAEEMRAAEERGAALPPDQGGLPTLAMMEAAGAALAAAVLEKGPKGKVAVFVGPGANGGDGWVAARALHQVKRDVVVFQMVPKDDLKGDAAKMAALYEGQATTGLDEALNGASVLIDCLFGTGLSRPLEGAALEIVRAIAAHRGPSGQPAFKLSADIPSGVRSDTGRVDGAAVAADMTLAFGAKKPCHLLFPARQYCGEVLVVDVKIPQAAIVSGAPSTFENGPGLWGACFPQPTFQSHKYTRGAVAVVSGPELATGAARLSARGALRIGAGAVTLFANQNAARECAAHETAIMVKATGSSGDLADALSTGKWKSVVIGPGNGVGDQTAETVRAVSSLKLPIVLDADGLTSFEHEPPALYALLKETDVLTPHFGEFARIFPNEKDSVALNKLTATRATAHRAGAVVLHKGPDTVIAAPDGRAAINANAPAYLATAGSGDVLAGFIAGLIAQGMPSFEAACAGVWIHGAAGHRFGPGLIAEDLPEAAPKVLRSLLGING